MDSPPDRPLGGGVVLCALANRVGSSLPGAEMGENCITEVTCPWTVEAHCDPQLSQRCANDLLLQVDSCRNFWLVWENECLAACEAF